MGNANRQGGDKIMSKKKLTKTDERKDISKKKKEQERTKIAKKLFIEMWGKYRGVISIICDKIDIARQTYYEWRDEDQQFAAAIQKANYNMLDEVEDMLMSKVFIERDGPSIRFFLERKHPAYKPKTETTLIPGEKVEPIQVEIIKKNESTSNGSLPKELGEQKKDSIKPGGDEKFQNILVGAIVHIAGKTGK